MSSRVFRFRFYFKIHKFCASLGSVSLICNIHTIIYNKSNNGGKNGLKLKLKIFNLCAEEILAWHGMYIVYVIN